MTADNSTLKENEATTTNRLNDVVTAIKSPQLSLVLASKYGVRSFSKAIGTYFLFSIVNLSFIGIAAFNWFATDFSSINGKILTTTLIIGLLATAYACTRAYKNFIFDILTAIYKELLIPIFKKLSIVFIQRSDAIRAGEFKMKQKEIKKELRTGKFINDQKQRLPKIIQKGIWLLLKQIPIVGMLVEVDETVRQENKEKASEELYHKMNSHIENKLFKKNNFSWLLWLLPLNVIVQVYFLFYYP